MSPGACMAKYQNIEVELQRMREIKEAIERQLVELQTMIERTEGMVKADAPVAPTAESPPASGR